jgi:hypothetical protein
MDIGIAKKMDETIDKRIDYARLNCWLNIPKLEISKFSFKKKRDILCDLLIKGSKFLRIPKKS